MPIVSPKHFYRFEAKVSFLIETDEVSAAADAGFSLLDKIRTSGTVNGVQHSCPKILDVHLEAEKGGES